MKSIKIILSNLLLSAMIFSCSSQLPVYKVSIFEEDKIEYNHYDEDGKIFYELSKDNDYLYVNIRTNDLPLQIKILNSGVKICIDNTERKKCDNYIQFPESNNKQNKAELRALGDNNNEIIKMKVANLSDEILFVKDNSKEKLNRYINTKDISTDISIEDENLDYLIKFPLNSFSLKSTQFPLLGIVIKGITRPSSSNTSQGGRPSGTGGRSGGGKSRGGGRGGGRSTAASGRRPSGNSNEMSQFKSLDKDIEIWNKLEF